MTTIAFSLPNPLTEDGHRLQLAVAGYLARFKGLSRTHAESDLRAYLTWCRERRVEPQAASRPQVELYVRWMQEIRRLKPSTVSPRCRSSPASTAPQSSTTGSSTRRSGMRASSRNQRDAPS
jgi:hypothetical protein